MTEIEIVVEPAARVSTLLLRLRGVLNTQTVDAFEKAIASRRAEEWKLWVADLGALEHVSSSGVGFLVTLALEQRKKGNDFVLSGMNPRVERMLQMTGFADLFSLKNATEK